MLQLLVNVSFIEEGSKNIIMEDTVLELLCDLIAPSQGERVHIQVASLALLLLRNLSFRKEHKSALLGSNRLISALLYNLDVTHSSSSSIEPSIAQLAIKAHRLVFVYVVTYC